MRATLPLAVLVWAAVTGPLCGQDLTARPQIPAARAQVARSTLAQWLAPNAIAVPRTFDVNGTRPAHEIAVVWEEPGAERDGARAPGNVTRRGTGPTELRIVRRIVAGSHMPRLRSVRIAEGRLLAAAVDASGTLRGVAVIADPRVVRSEWPGPDGVLTGRTLRLPRAEFLLPVPDEANVVAIRLFEPRWNGEAFVLTPVAFVQVPGGATP